MKGELNSEAPTSSQDSNHPEGVSSPLALNFSVTVDPEVINAVKELAGALDRVSALVAWEERPFKATIVSRPDWIQIPGAMNRRAVYHEQCGIVILRYESSSEVETTWNEIGVLSKMEEVEYKAACKKRFPKKSQRQQITGLNHMVNAYRDGLFGQKTEQKTPKTEQKPAKTYRNGKIPQERTQVLGFKAISYIEKGDALKIWYGDSPVHTTWGKIKELSENGQQNFTDLIPGYDGGYAAQNKVRAFQQFVSAYERGIVKPSTGEPEKELETNFARFQAEEDGMGAC